MTNEELKKKIKEILRKRMTELLGSCHTDEIPLTEEGAEAILFYADEFADALIAAGIGDVKESENKTTAAELVAQAAASTAIKKIAEWKHRAEVAERALDLCETAYILSLNHRATEGVSGQAIASDLGIHKFFMEQAEKELAEENSGKKKI